MGPTPSSWENFNLSTMHYKGDDKGRSNGRPTPVISIPFNQQSISNPTSPTTATSSARTTPITSPHDSNGNLKYKKEVAVHTTTNWKKAFSLGGKEKSPKSAHTGEIAGWWEDPEDPVHALNACAPAMLQLWKDSNVRQRLLEKRLRLEESSGL